MDEKDKVEPGDGFDIEDIISAIDEEIKKRLLNEPDKEKRRELIRILKGK